MLLCCDRCKKDGAVKITLTFYKSISGEKHNEIKDICTDCMMNLIVRLLDRLPSEEKIAFFQQFMKGIII